MKPIIKCMELDYLLLKPYLKSVLLVLLVPMLFPFFTGTLFEGLSFAVTVMAMTTGYTFSVAEKNGLNRFYGFLPVSKSALVAGRYLFLFALGFLALLATLAVQVVLLSSFKENTPAVPEIWRTLFACAVLFCFYAGIQIPGYYRFGAIKGRAFMFVPTVGFLLIYFMARLFAGERDGFEFNFVPNDTMLIAGSVGIMAVLILASAAASIKIVLKNRA